MSENEKTRSLLRHASAKVPEVTVFFWIVKILTTAMGESTSDFLVNHMDPVLAVGLGFLGFAMAMVLQFSVRKYVAWAYWFAALMVAVFGTMVADVMHVVLGVPYAASVIGFAIALVVIFGVWHASEKTLSIHSIYTARREIFYWLTVLATFALGTATGDLTATTFGWGYLASGITFAIVIAAIAVSHFIAKAILGAEHKRLSRNAALAFWLAYVFTRPLGASFADWIGKSQSVGGLGWGDGTASIIFFIPLLCLVAYLAASKRDIQTHVKTYEGLDQK